MSHMNQQTYTGAHACTHAHHTHKQTHTPQEGKDFDDDVKT